MCVLLEKTCTTFTWFQKALSYVAITCRIVHKPERLGFTERKLRSQTFLEAWNASVWGWFTAFLLSQNCNIWELKVPDIVYSTMQHTNTPCEKNNNNKKISPTSVSLLPSRGNIEPILITITCTHHARSRKSWKNKISKGLSATSKANRNDGKRDLRFILVYMTEANKW